MSVTTVKFQLPAGKPVAPPTGSTKKPLPLDVVGIVVPAASLMCDAGVIAVPAGGALRGDVVRLVVSTVPVPLLLILQPPACELAVLREVP